MSLLDQLGISKRAWEKANVNPAKDINPSELARYGGEITTVSTLLGSGRRSARTRNQIYEKWADMEANPICSTAIGLLVTAALGGHETTGDTVFIEKTPEAEKDKKLGVMVEEISHDLSQIFNKVSYQIAYTAANYGDAYARIYTDNKNGVIQLCPDDLLRPQVIQPFERGGKTVGYAVSLGSRNFERMDITQLARMKMPRTQYIAQSGIIQKALLAVVTEDDCTALPIVPSAAGGSLNYNAEEAYDNLIASLIGLVGQRWMDSIDEQMVTVNMDSMTQEQQSRFLSSLKKMLVKSKALAEDAVANNQPVLERVRHIIPVFNEKQVTNITPAGGGQARSSTITIDDIMLHAKLLSGAYGVDLSMIGFADLMSGGLGEGGFFRTSAQAAERARIIRSSMAEFYNDVIDIHTMKKYGGVFDPKTRPWRINYYGSISALESERQKTRSDSMNAGMILAQAMQQFKDAGASVEMMQNFLTKEMLLDEDQAKLYAAIVEAKDDDADKGGGGFPGADE